jgi:uncharacterized SAM-binding protein YcdF (DUF218 family)
MLPWCRTLVKEVTRLRFARRSSVWCPTWLGLFCAFALLVSIGGWWWIYGESFFSLTRRLPAEVLVVEGWIGRDGLHAAAVEFQQGGYRYVVSSGGLSSDRWEEHRTSYAEIAQHYLIRFGVPKDKIIVAPCTAESMRTYESAVAVSQALRASGVVTNSFNVFTLGSHARRSRLVFAKVEGPKVAVGVVGWIPSDYEGVPWWHSSERARELLVETAGYMFEVLFNSGRSSKSPNGDAARDLVQNRYGGMFTPKRLKFGVCS